MCWVDVILVSNLQTWYITQEFGWVEVYDSINIYYAPLGARPSELAMEAKQTKSKDLGIASTRGDKGTWWSHCILKILCYWLENIVWAYQQHFTEWDCFGICSNWGYVCCSVNDLLLLFGYCMIEYVMFRRYLVFLAFMFFLMWNFVWVKA